MPQGLIPKEKAKPSTIAVFFFYFSLVFFLISVVITLILMFKVSPLKREFLSNRNYLSRIETPEDKAIEKKVLSIKQPLKDFLEVFKKRKMVSKFLGVLEKTTHPHVSFVNMSLDTSDDKVRLDGHTESFQDLGEQMLLQEHNRYVKSVNLSKIAFNKGGGIDFSLEISLSPEVFAFETKQK